MKIRILSAFILGLAIAGGLSVRAAGTILYPIGGGTGQNTLTSSQLLYGAGQNPVQTIATSTRTFSSSFTTTGTLGYLVGGTNSTVDLSNTGVTAGTYGTSTSTPQLTVDAQGRLSSVVSVPIAIAGSKAYYAYSIMATSSSAYYNMNPTATTSSVTVAYALSTSPQTVQNWISPTGDPGISVIPGGNYIVDLFAWRSSGSASITLAVQVWEVSSTGADISQIGTTNSTPNLTNAKAQYQVSFTTSEHTMASSASRILMRVVATTAGTPTLSLAMGGADQMDLTTPGATVDVTNFVPYVGATANLNLGSNSASTTQLTVSNNTYLPLTGLLKGTGAGNAVTTGSNGTDFTLTSAQTCSSNNFVSALTASGGSTCSSIAIPKGNFFVGNDSGVAQATSTIFISSTGNVGIASTTPAFRFSVNTLGSNFYIDSTGKVVGYDATNAWEGRISPTHTLVVAAATSTATWTGTSTPGVDASVSTVATYAGTVRKIRCTSNTFLGFTLKINSTAVTPSYFVASSTVGVIPITANNTFNAGDTITPYFGTTTSLTATPSANASCSIDVTETP